MKRFRTYEIRYVERRFHLFGCEFDSSLDPDVLNGSIFASVGTQKAVDKWLSHEYAPELCRVRFVESAYEVWVDVHDDPASAAERQTGADRYGLVDAFDSLADALEDVEQRLSFSVRNHPDVEAMWEQIGPVWLMTGARVVA